MKLAHLIVSLALFPALVQSGAAVGQGREAPTEQVVVAEGQDSEVALAARNAAYNALVQVVGAFIDSKKAFERKAQIDDGLRTESKRISVDIREYSQGSIKSFEILEVLKEGGFVRVRARVVVRNEDFRAYVRKLAEAEAPVDGLGMFAQIQTQQRQNANQASLLLSNVINPIVSGEVVVFNVSPPQLVSQMPGDVHSGRDRSAASVAIDGLARRFGRETLVSFDVDVSLNPGFRENMRATLEGIASSKELIQSGLARPDTRLANMDTVSDTLVLIHDGNAPLDIRRLPTSQNEPVMWTRYRASGSRRALVDGSKWLAEALREGAMPWRHTPVNTLEVTIIGAGGENLQQELVGRSLQSQKMILSSRDYTPAINGFARNPIRGDGFSDPPPWSLLGILSSGGTAFLIVERRKFNIVMSVDPLAIQRARDIRVRLRN